MTCLSLLICHITRIIFHININAVFHFNQVQTKSEGFARLSLRDIFYKNPLIKTANHQRRKIVCFGCICRMLRYSQLSKNCVMRNQRHCLSEASLALISHGFSSFLMTQNILASETAPKTNYFSARPLSKDFLYSSISESILPSPAL